MYHQPVLLNESTAGLNIIPSGIYVDVTFGGGGHSKEILKHLPNGKLFGFDQDGDAKANVIDDERFTLIPQNFNYLKNFLRFHGVSSIDGLLADLGVSSHQFDDAQRGFSFRFDAPLDMRMNQADPLTAAAVINTYNEEALSDIFFYYGELHQAKKIASLIVQQRALSSIQTTFQLKEALKKMTPPKIEHKFLAQVFQSLRLEVNHELDALKSMLEQALEILKPGGRLVVISYHSLEDRLVKNFLKTGNFEGVLHKDFYGHEITPFRLISRKAIVPTETEMNENNRARSAKLRIAEKKDLSKNE